jgi:hypothetical protein
MAGLFMPIRIGQVHHVSILGLLILSVMATPGCLAMVWLGAVGIDMTRTSEIEFQSFENTWLVERQERQELALMKSIAVIPFVGDPAMAERWTAVFRELTALRIVSPSDASQHSIQRVDSQVDCVLTGTVVDQESTRTFAGLKERLLRRLYLHLVSDSGTLIWKTELPYTIEKGSKNLSEELVTKVLLAHVRAHAVDIGLAELGRRSQRIVSRSPA